MSIHIQGVVELGYSSSYYEGFAKIDLGRADAYYAALASEKANTHPLRGFPENASFMARLELAFYVLDTDQPAPYDVYVRRADAEEDVANGIARWWDKEQKQIYYIRETSWVTHDELQAVIPLLSDYHAVQYLAAVLAMMDALDPNATRFVYWFT